ncbi:MAG TPA: asparagine synthase (glutamine-hydrolyzing) [Syntrophales bacterium]|nr:asparagine synthase (glutamine-hydrolyzing) [Syntrophales bacterium]HOO00870.1 asparagine synthase (glutamine-hydrolyzing) [Syntrophales bacterium]
MCGVCGEFRFNGEPVRTKDIELMVGSLRHRGPDAHGLYCEGPLGLGHTRLAIIDLSAAGNQPMWSGQGDLCIAYNGEVYNYKEIKKELEACGYVFRSSSDTEVVVNAIECWGMAGALQRFIGMFAFALWDGRTRRLFLCRDRAGIKPLYYYKTNEIIIFGSELKAICAHPSFQKEIDPQALGQHFINGYILTPRSIFKNVGKVPPGHYLVVDSKGKTTLERYWSLDTINRDSFSGDFYDALQELEELLCSAFSYRLVSDVPVALFLSGGIDSSLVSTLLKKRYDVDILNITIGFRERNYDESAKAEKVSSSLGVKHIVHYVNEKEAQDSLEEFCHIYDEPYGDTSGIPTAILSRLARQHVKVALSADGGDEQFYGYENYAEYARHYRWMSKCPLALRLILSRLLADFMPYRTLLSFRGALARQESFFPQGIARYEKMLRLLKVRDDVDLLRLMNEKAFPEESLLPVSSPISPGVLEGTALGRDALSRGRSDLEDAMMRTDYQAFLRDDILVKVDRASMHVSLECRDPFLDHRIAELAFRLPLRFLYNKGEHKHILKTILRKYLPEEVVSAPKRGFMIPLYYWLRGVWKPFVMEYLSPSKVRKVGLLDEKIVGREVDRFYRYHGYRAEKIWMMMNFQMWAERWYQKN